MPNINAALGLAQLEMLNKFLISKRNLAKKYAEFFANTNIIYCKEPKDSLSNYWLNCILLKDRQERDAFLKFTNENGVMTRPAWQLMNKLPMFGYCQTDDLEIAYNICDRLVNIPSSFIIDK
jgi:dTDP-4-amino-4,6-dideoxygalactose transaminase